MKILLIGGTDTISMAVTKLLAKQNVFTVGDLLQYYPRDYEDRTRKITLSEFQFGFVTQE